ncbi:FHA domain-containing protein [Herpetosiphon geysericola]|uniref:FHA domain-containing protein n=1 Tax=Herpetosiphon geysericola TaxID=70996 RepID=UPI0006C8EAA1|nr:FHA domain-containing protein [Herpetosiphon geysericola]
MAKSYAQILTKDLREILNIHRRNLGMLEIQASQVGIHISTELNNSIYREQQAIESIMAEFELRQAEPIAMAEINANAPYAYLSLMKDNQRLSTHGLAFDYVTIGRSQCAIIIAQTYGMVSNLHCAIIRQGRRMFIQDLESRRGTYLNDDKIQDRLQLKVGDQISLGPNQNTESAVLLFHQYEKVIPTK